MDKEEYQFDWDNVAILGQANQRHAREFWEVWLSNQNSINKHLELDPIYKPLRNKSGSDTTHPSKLRHINSKWDRTLMLHWRRTGDVTLYGDKTCANKLISST
eukprot:g19000.t1